jgi:hypothetical protein
MRRRPPARGRPRGLPAASPPPQMRWRQPRDSLEGALRRSPGGLEGNSAPATAWRTCDGVPLAASRACGGGPCDSLEDARWSFPATAPKGRTVVSCDDVDIQ